jgi:hypothetical protein
MVLQKFYTLWVARFFRIRFLVAAPAKKKKMKTIKRSIKYWKLNAKSTNPSNMAHNNTKNIASRSPMLNESRASGNKKYIEIPNIDEINAKLILPHGMPYPETSISILTA